MTSKTSDEEALLEPLSPDPTRRDVLVFEVVERFGERLAPVGLDRIEQRPAVEPQEVGEEIFTPPLRADAQLPRGSA